MIGYLFDKLNHFFERKPEAGKDFLGAYPLNVHIGAYPERRYMWTMRRLAVIAIVSLCLNTVLAFLSIVLVHKVDAEMTLAQYVEQKNVVKRIGPGGGVYSAKGVYVEKKIVEFIFLRNTVIDNLKKMEERWSNDSYLRYLADDAWSNTKTHIGNKLNDLKKYGITQNVRITDISTRSFDGQRSYHVKFLLKRNNVPSEVRPQIIKCYAYIEVGFNMNASGSLKETRFLSYLSDNQEGDAGKYKRQEYELKNPLGFVVRNYSEVVSYVTNNKERDELIKEFEKPDDYKTFIMLDFDGDLEGNE
jgi:hypothetical protein